MSSADLCAACPRRMAPLAARGAAAPAWVVVGGAPEPEDIAGVALLLASRAGAFITGQTIIVDGGTTIAP